jgi:4-amino-4-deoxy-L-arabinose transferase-like glycosyltransferase
MEEDAIKMNSYNTLYTRPHPVTKQGTIWKRFVKQPFSEARTDVMRATQWTDIAIVVLTVAACAIPFLNQPFHMDDNFYMDMARNAQVNPFFPNDTPYMYQEIFFPDMGSHSHPPLQTYFLATVMHFFGEGAGKEWIYHLFALFYPILAVLSFYFVAALFVGRPLWPAIVLACSPLFMVMEHTLMTDIPMLAFWLAAIASFLWAVRRENTGLYAMSALFQVAAVFTSYQSLALTPLLGFYQLRRGRRRRNWMWLMIAPAAVTIWFTVNCFHYRRLLWGGTLNFIQSRNPLAPHVLGIKLLSVFEYQGWLIVFPFFIFYLLARNLKGRALILVLLAALCLAQFTIAGYRLVDKSIFVFGLAAGFFVTLEMGKIAGDSILKRQSRLGLEKIEVQFIALWYFGVLLYCLFFLTEGSARYILPLVPPFLICFFRILEISEVTEYRSPLRILNSAMLASGSLVVSLVCGLVLSHADQEFARIYPRAAKQFSGIADAMKSYCVGEWGFRYYFGRIGAKPLPADESLVRGGSFIAVPKLALPHEIPADLRSMTMQVQTLAFKPDTPLRIFDWQTPAGFYSSGWGLIPFSFSRGALEEIEVMQVNFMVERLPWAEIETDSTIKPWPGHLNLQSKTHLAVMVKSGTQIIYPWPLRERKQLRLLCGISPDSYEDRPDASFVFEIRQLGEDGGVLAESKVTLRPGTKNEERDWQPVQMVLNPTLRGVLDFRYFCAGKGSAVGTGAFAQSILEPVH